MKNHLEEPFLQATEWNLATLEELCLLKSSSQSRIQRQVSICTKMLMTCRTLDHEVRRGARCQPLRVNQVLNEVQSSGKALDEVMTEYVENLRKDL